MDLFETLTGFLKGAVGNTLDNAPEDVLTVKRSLSRAGHYDIGEAPEPHGYLTKAMDESIRNFQKDNNLRVDGTLLPGGETERSLYEATTGRSADEAFGRARNENAEKVGFGGNIIGTIAHIAAPQRELLRASQTQPAPRTDVTRSARDSSEDDALPAGSFGHPAQNVDATGRIRKTAQPILEKKPTVSEFSRSSFDLRNAPTINLAKDRVESLLKNTPAKFDIRPVAKVWDSRRDHVVIQSIPCGRPERCFRPFRLLHEGRSFDAIWWNSSG